MADITPGPWDVEIRGTVPLIVQVSNTKRRKLGLTPALALPQRDRGSIAVVSDVYMDRAQRLANATAIAALPDLLETAEAHLKHNSAATHVRLEAAIAKAKGDNDGNTK